MKRTLLITILVLLAGVACQPQSPPPEPTATAVQAAVAEPTATPEAATVAPTPTLTTAPQTATPALAPSPTAPPPAPTPVSCELTAPDMLGPFYVPDAPERASVGQGHVLRGVVRSGEDCAPVANAKIEFWLAGPDGQYGDAYRATLFATEAGGYEFQSNAPPPYASRPPHIHIRVTADGFEPLVTQYYPAAGQTEGAFDLVLRPGGDDSASLPAAPAATVTNVPAPGLFDIPWQDRSVFLAGLVEAEQPILEELPGASVYHIELDIADDLRTLSGQQEVLYTNTEIQPLNELYFRLFPNIANGQTSISNLAVNGEAVTSLFELRDSAMRVPLPAALPPGESVVVSMDFTIRVPPAEGGNYGTFAFLREVLALAHFYPFIAVYDDEGWNVEIAPSIGDVIYGDSSFYLVRVTAPASQMLAASGIELGREASGDRQTVTFAAGPMRDFYLVSSARYAVTSRTVGETVVNSYAPAELADGSAAALEAAALSLESFNRRFGPYPFTELDLVSTTTFALGVEYPGIVAILEDLYAEGHMRGQATGNLLESVVAHEVAHQWFYSTVGNDQVDEPWLDEALAQYATLIYYQDVYGPEGAAGFRQSLERRWNRIAETDMPIGRPVRDYTVDEYSAIVYGRGPLFIEALAGAMGEEAFARFLQEYYRTYRWGVATGPEFQQLAEQECGCDLSDLFETWVYGPDSAGQAAN